MTYIIYYIRDGAQRHYSFVGTAQEKDAKISAMLATDGVSAVWFTE